MKISSLFILPVQYSVNNYKRGCWKGILFFFLFARNLAGKVVA